MSQVDLSQLAIDRGGSSGGAVRPRRQWLSRYVLPAALLAGFIALGIWSAWEMVFPARPVTVVPVLATRAEVRREGTLLFQAAGWIEPRPTAVRAAALAPGVVQRLLVVEDQPVKAGEPVAELVKDDARLALEAAEATYRLRESEVEEARAELAAAAVRLKQPVHLTAPLGEAEAALAQVETELNNLPFALRRAIARRDFAQKDYDGKRAAKGAVSGRAIDEAQSQLETAAALAAELRDRKALLKNERAALILRRDALKTQLELLTDEIQARDEAAARMEAARARLEQARVMVAEAKLRLDRMTVRSPVDGRVYRLIGDPGTRVGSSGATRMPGYDSSTVVTLYRPDKLQVRVDVRFEDVPQVSQGQPVRIENAALSAPLTGQVLFISSEADIQKNTLEVKVAIDSPPAVFKPEMLVDVAFLAPARPDTEAEPSQERRLYVPQQLVRQGADGAFVWLADRSAGIARRQAVTTGMAGMGDLIEIKSGLTLSSRLITGETSGLEDGARIRVAGEAS